MVVNADDPNAEILGGVNLDARRVSFALEPTPVGRGIVDVSARLERIDGSGTRMSLHGFHRELDLHLPLVGTTGCNLCIGRGGFGLGHGDRRGQRHRRFGVSSDHRRTS